MKNTFFLFLATLVIVSCSDVQSNYPAFQADVDNVFFRSDITTVNYFSESDYFIIEGKSGSETIKLSVKNSVTGIPLNFGIDSENVATFEKASGVIYTTVSEIGSGKLIFSEIDESERTVSGNFNFTAITSGLDTLTVSSGVFYKVSYNDGVEED